MLQYIAFKILVVVLYAISLQTGFTEAKSPLEECHLCESRECLYQANMLVKHMNPRIDPCQDFYSFACGGYLQKFGRDDTRSVYDDTWNAFLIRIKSLLEHLKPNNGTVSEKLKTVYDICMDMEFSEIKAVPDALDFLSHVGIPDWPSLDPDFQFAELSETLGSLAVYGEFAFITFQPSPYQKREPSQLPSALILPDNYLMDNQLKRKDTHRAVLRILSYFGFDAEAAETEWKRFKTMENDGIKLQNEETANDPACISGPSSTYTKVNCSADTHGSMAFLCNIWKSAIKRGDLSRYYSSDTLHISCRWNHYSYIGKIFSSLTTLNQRSLANYLSLRFFTSHLDDLNLYFQLLKKSFSKSKNSDHKTSDTVYRMEYCIGWIIKSMPLALGLEYIQRYVEEPIEKDVLDILQGYIDELTNRMDTQTWINERVKLYLKRQLEKLDVGFKKSMKNFRNETSVANSYKEFQPVKGRSFLKNILEYTKTAVAAKKENSNFNSFYSSSDSYTMDFGLSLFLPPTYSYGLPKMINYATLGWIIGHELSHNFKFFFDLVHLENETENSLNTKVECYANQYNHYVMEKTGKKISSKETEEEITVDNIGWTLTEKIMESFRDVTINISLPGVEYTPLQIMYISFAQDFCAALSKEVEKEYYTSKPQDVQKLRVLTVLQNSKTFSETFNCSMKQTMNPSFKCIFFD